MNFPKELDQEDFDLIVKEWKLAGFEVELCANHFYVQIPVSVDEARIFARYARFPGGGYMLDHFYDDAGDAVAMRITLLGKLL